MASDNPILNSPYDEPLLHYGHKSHPVEIKKKGQKFAIRVISQFGEECTKVLES